MASDWRESLQRQKLDKMSTAEWFPDGKPKTLEEVKRRAVQFVRVDGGPAFLACLNILEVPSKVRGPIFARWLDEGSPSMSVFAPYAAYVTGVQLFFRLAVSVDLISGQRASHTADMGKWRIFSPEVEEREKARRAEGRATKEDKVTASIVRDTPNGTESGSQSG